MSIKEFEDTLRSKLVADFNKLGAKRLYVDASYWRALILEDKYAQLNNFMSFDPDFKYNERFRRIINIPGFDKFLQANGITPNLIVRQVTSDLPVVWVELCIQYMDRSI